MNLSGQQQPSVIQQEGAGFSTVAPEGSLHSAETLFALGTETEQTPSLSAISPGNSLALQLETRLNGLLYTLSTLNAKNSELHQIISDRDAYVELLEEENALLNQQVEQFTATQGQVIDGLAHILDRFPGGAWLAQAGEGFDRSMSSLLEERVGTA